MDKLLIVALGLLGFSSIHAQPELVRLNADGRGFSVKVPVEWRKNSKTKFFSVSSPGGEIAITASAYRSKKGMLGAFSKLRFSAVRKLYKPTTQVYKIRNGVVREYEGTWPGAKNPTYYTVAALSVGKLYISMTFVTNRSDFTRNKKMYIQILESVKEHN